MKLLAMFGHNLTPPLPTAKATDVKAAAPSPAGPARLYTRFGAVGVVQVVGPVMQHADWVDLRMGANSTDDLTAALAAAAADPAATTVLIEVASGGGSVAGVGDIRAAVDRLKASGKRVIAFAHDSMHSASYYAYSAADEIIASPTATGGSLGVYSVVVDASAAAAAQGVKLIQVKPDSVTAKHGSADGLPWSPEELASVQRIAEVFQAQMREDILRDRPTANPAVFDGRALAAADLLAANLIDRVADFWAEIDRLNTSASPLTPPVIPTPAAAPTGAAPKKKEPRMAAASIAELKAAFPNESDFVLACVEQQLELSAAQAIFAASAAKAKAHADALAANAAEIAQLKADLAAKTAPATKPAPRAAAGTVPPVGSAAGETKAANPADQLDRGTAEAYLARVEHLLGEPLKDGTPRTRAQALDDAKKADKIGFRAYLAANRGVM